MRIRDIARIRGREVISVKPHAPLSEVLRELSNNKIGAMPVCDFKGTLLGIISERDIIRWLHRGNTDLEATQAKDIMTYKVFTASPEDDLDTILRLMTVKGIRHMPIMLGTRCVSMLSLRDVIEQQLKGTAVAVKTTEETATPQPPADPSKRTPLSHSAS